jgi:hypothetical protein
MSILEKMNEIKKLRPLADEDVDSGPVQTLSARRGRKAQAKERLKSLTDEYSKELLNSALFIVVSGENREDFITEGSKFGCFSVDSEEFYKDLASRIPASLYLGKSTVSNVFDILGRHLEDKMSELGVVGYPQLLFKQEYAQQLNSKDEFTNLVKRAINDQLGSEIVGLQSIRSLVPTFISTDYAEKNTPIILSTGDDKLALSLLKDLKRLTSKVFLVTVGEASDKLKNENSIQLKEANNKSINQAMKLIKNSIKK